MGWLINQAGKLEPVVMSPAGLDFRCYEEKSIDMVFRKLPKCHGVGGMLGVPAKSTPSNLGVPLELEIGKRVSTRQRALK
jgi:hypothetical protein